MQIQRFGSVIKVKPEKLEQYKKLYATAWPGVLEMISECNGRNYTIYSKDGFLVSFFEYTGENYKAEMRKMAAAPLPGNGGKYVSAIP